MSVVTNEIRRQIRDTASSAQVYLYETPASGEVLSSIAAKHTIAAAAYLKFASTVGDIILGFYNIADTEPLLIQELGIDPAKAQALTQDVLEFLAPLSDPNWQPPAEAEVPEDTSADAVPLAPAAAAPEQADQAQPLVQPVPEAMPQIRTMQSDMQYHNDIAPIPSADTVYQSQQDSVRGALTDTPQYTEPTPDEEQRWGQ